MVNNYDWTASLSTIDFLRDVGKHFPVNRMLARDVVKSRLEAGISYTEFSYVLLQSMDFLNLYRDYGVTLQFGGSDQWGNLTGGVELIRRSDSGKAHAFATPLVTKSDGTKYGKTEGGALWLDPEMMSPYAFYQFWLNVEDEKVGELLRIFTFLTRTEIEEIEAQHAEKPFLRAGQRALAEQVTTIVHGADETERIKAASAALFGGGDLTGLSTTTLGAALREAGSATIDGDEPMPTVVDLLVAAGLAKSKGEARRTVSEGGAYLNNARVEDPDQVPAAGRPDRRLLARAPPRQEELRRQSRCAEPCGPAAGRGPQTASDLRKRRCAPPSRLLDLNSVARSPNVLRVARERREARPVRSGLRPRRTSSPLTHLSGGEASSSRSPPKLARMCCALCKMRRKSPELHRGKQSAKFKPLPRTGRPKGRTSECV